MQEIWLPVKGFEGKYEVSSLGRVRGLISGIVLKPTPQRRGYLYVHLSENGKNRHFRLHRLVAAHFIRPPLDGEQINHKDFDIGNNRVDNLEWCTNRENKIHSMVNNRPIKKVYRMPKETEGRLLSTIANNPRRTLVDIGKEFGIDDDRIRDLLKRTARHGSSRLNRS